MSGSLEFALISCVLLGLRHGFDYDHLAAILDITSVERSVRESMRLGLLYALGHALTVTVLGLGVLCLHLSLPKGLDALDERLVGLTLIALSVYVVYGMVRAKKAGHSHVSVSRVAMLISGAQYAAWRVRRVVWADAPRPEAFRFKYGSSSAFFVGIVHGLGAETPSQLMLFLLAANLGGTSRGVLGLACFIAGLLVMNTLMTAGASGVFAGGRESSRLQWVMTSLTAIYSFAVGGIFLFGLSDKLPALTR